MTLLDGASSLVSFSRVGRLFHAFASSWYSLLADGGCGGGSPGPVVQRCSVHRNEAALRSTRAMARDTKTKRLVAGKRRLVRLRRTDGDRHYPRVCPPHVALTDDAWDCEKAKAAVQQKIGTDSEQLLLAQDLGRHCLVAASFARGCTTARSAR